MELVIWNWALPIRRGRDGWRGERPLLFGFRIVLFGFLTDTTLPKQYTWFKIADHINEIEFADNNISLIEVNGKRVCIASYKDEIFAFTNKCPHAGGMMSEGYIDALGNVVCPMHRYKYDMRNGRNTSGEGYYLTHWPIETREDGIYVGMETGSGLFGWFR